MTLTPQTNSTLEEIAEVIGAHDNFVICGHVSPDGDCLGSQLALHHALRALGKTSACVLVADEPVSASLRFMPGCESLVPAERFAGECDVFVGVDVPMRERIGAAAALLDSAGTSITIDHHAADVPMCEHVYVDPDSASASMLVWELVKLLADGNPPFDSALCAYTGLVTDTGGFRFQNSDRRAFAVAAELVGQGVDPAYVATNVFQRRTFQSLRLESIAIAHMESVAGGKGVTSWVSKADLESVGAVKADIDPLIDTVRSLEGARVACLLSEQGGLVKGSLRSKDDTDVAELARTLGGGGHKAAAGIKLDMSIDEARSLMREKLADFLAE